jgi:hypothetical protein
MAKLHREEMSFLLLDSVFLENEKKDKQNWKDRKDKDHGWKIGEKIRKH